MDEQVEAEQKVIETPTAEVTPPVKVESAPVKSEEEPKWLNPRLEQAKSSATKELLEELGASDLEQAKLIISEAQKIRESQMSDQEKQATRLATLEKEAEKVTSLQNTVKTIADSQLAALSEAQRSAVSEIAGSDPSGVISAINALRPTWAQAAPVKVEKAPDTVAGGGPPDSGGTSEPDLSAQLAHLQETNPFAAARLVQQHGTGKFIQK